jgi:hypothetical protein
MDNPNPHNPDRNLPQGLVCECRSCRRKREFENQRREEARS